MHQAQGVNSAIFGSVQYFVNCPAVPTMSNIIFAHEKTQNITTLAPQASHVFSVTKACTQTLITSVPWRDFLEKNPSLKTWVGRLPLVDISVEPAPNSPSLPFRLITVNVQPS
jgi:hypothetical protein